MGGTNQGYTCNCDNMVPTIQHDRGVITDSSALPILGFKYGLMLYPAQIATINIGRFMCMGKKAINPDDVADSCATLKTYGITESGNYILNNQNVVFCNMDKLIDDSDIQTQVGKLWCVDDVEDVRFIVYNDDAGYVASGKITYSGQAVDSANAINYSTGIFRAPISGTYFFSISGNYYAQSADIKAYLNGDELYEFIDVMYSANENRQLAFDFTTYMSSGGELYMYDSNTDGFFNTRNPLIFSGRLI